MSEKQIQRKHIFAVNGEPDFLNLIRELMQEERYNVTTTNFVPDTFGQIDAAKPDLLMVDLVVGERVGWELLAHLASAAETRNIPVIVFSTDPGLLEKAQEDPAYGGKRFLSKPMDLDDVLTGVHELIGGA